MYTSTRTAGKFVFDFAFFTLYLYYIYTYFDVISDHFRSLPKSLEKNNHWSIILRGLNGARLRTLYIFIFSSLCTRFRVKRFLGSFTSRAVSGSKLKVFFRNFFKLKGYTRKPVKTKGKFTKKKFNSDKIDFGF